MGRRCSGGWLMSWAWPVRVRRKEQIWRRSGRPCGRKWCKCEHGCASALPREVGGHLRHSTAASVSHIIYYTDEGSPISFDPSAQLAALVLGCG